MFGNESVKYVANTAQSKLQGLDLEGLATPDTPRLPQRKSLPVCQTRAQQMPFG